MADNLKYSSISLAIVCPMANERQSAKAFVLDVVTICRSLHFKSVLFYAILDNASKDGTKEILESLSQNISELKIVFAPENRNVVDAYKRGYREALAYDSDWILEIDAGYSHQPSDMPSFFLTMMEGNYDCVFGSRFCTEAKIINRSVGKYIISRGGTLLTNLLLGTKLRDMTSGFELFRKDALHLILSKGIFSNGPFFQTEIKVYSHAFKIVEVPIKYDASTSHIRHNTLSDALINLFRLFCLRYQKKLFISK